MVPLILAMAPSTVHRNEWLHGDKDSGTGLSSVHQKKPCYVCFSGWGCQKALQCVPNSDIEKCFCRKVQLFSLSLFLLPRPI